MEGVCGGAHDANEEVVGALLWGGIEALHLGPPKSTDVVGNGGGVVMKVKLEDSGLSVKRP